MLSIRPDIKHTDATETYLLPQDIMDIEYEKGKILKVTSGKGMGHTRYCRVLRAYPFYIVCQFFKETLYDNTFIAAINKVDIALQDILVEEV